MLFRYYLRSFSQPQPWPLNMLCLHGSPALSDFRLEKLQQKIRQKGCEVSDISATFLHLIDVDENALSEKEEGVLANLLTYGPASTQASID